MSDVEERIKTQLGTAGGLSSSDMGTFSREQSKVEEEPKGDPMNEDSEVTLEEDDLQTPAQVASRNRDPAQQQIAKTLDRLSSMFEEDIEESITITAAEKQIFLDTLIGNKRFELPFSLFNGKLTGRFRNRTNRESDAVMIELNRRVLEGLIVTDAEYATALRSGLMAFHIAELNGEKFTSPQEPLTQTRSFDSDEEVTVPVWMDKAIKFYCELQDGIVAALYRELLRFERKYWIMVKNANNQNFWKPEDYTSA